MKKTNKTSNPLAGPERHKTCCGITSSYREGKCSLIFPEKSEKWVCLSGTKYQENHQREGKLSDLAFFWVMSKGDEVRAYAIELKGGGAKPGQVVEQLQKGADLIHKVMESIPVTFVPVLVHASLTTLQIRDLKRARITFRGKSYMISLARCGSHLSQVRV
ncbi:hypothetical protein ABZX85_03845 [Streptomyces sp. NPDC004539]|uniref:hypothetical protein n=1 Tax=Streptomyces sp. NPDC004539 TaxID=3154280 RepID=UPI0033B5BBC6